MSDYLHHLVARTLSPEAGVRPQLRSAFEPMALHGGFPGPAGFELETRVELNPLDSLPLTVQTSFERVPSDEPPKAVATIPPTQDELPRHVVPPSPPTDHESTMTLKMLQPVINARPDLIPENSRADSTPPSTSRPDPIPVPRHLRTAPTSDTVPPAAAMVPHETVESGEPRSERIGLVAIRPLAPAAMVLSPSPSVAPTSDKTSPVAGAIRGQTVETEAPRSERYAAAAIRPVAPAAPVFPPSLPPAVAPAQPTIHVTIGRVEVRATLPPQAGSRAKPTLPPVMSLEDYLGRRANGGQR